ncbi:hypothetical protein [Paraburkholderia sp. J76]|nr:hypothetical protein [Paraburkholderia sp. J76]
MESQNCDDAIDGTRERATTRQVEPLTFRRVSDDGQDRHGKTVEK